ncbi:hypothetical protein DFH09DRAFT_1334631 [Mycena vulgaris]|nr:hypothetical protein DFH09DRAFT_1334631 [Mycena vulgaris]
MRAPLPLPPALPLAERRRRYSGRTAQLRPPQTRPSGLRHHVLEVRAPELRLSILHASFPRALRPRVSAVSLSCASSSPVSSRMTSLALHTSIESLQTDHRASGPRAPAPPRDLDFHIPSTSALNNPRQPRLRPRTVSTPSSPLRDAHLSPRVLEPPLRKLATSAPIEPPLREQADVPAVALLAPRSKLQTSLWNRPVMAE